MKRFLTAALVLSAASLFGCGADDDSSEGKAFPVTVSRVESIFLIEKIEATGELRAKEHADIASEVRGRVTEILIDEGAQVEAGAEVLAIDPERRTLERDSAQAGVVEARESVDEAAREVKRLRNLRKKSVASQTQLDQAETEQRRARARLLAAIARMGMMERALADARVTAPFAGYIARRRVSRGEFVQQGTKLFELVSLDPIEVEFNVTELESGRVALGQNVDVTMAPFPGETFVATVNFVSPTINTQTRTLRVKAQLDNAHGRFRPGLFAKIDLGISQRDDVAMVPEDAVLQRSDGHVVFRAIADSRVERIVVQTGTHHDGMVEITKGLTTRDLIVSRGQAWLADGQKVLLRHPDGTLATQALPAVAGSVDEQAHVP
jgi:membrane fusion protein (multidrug efflux system)